MSIRTSRWPEGVPCWADLTVPAVEAAKGFYTAVLGWNYTSTDLEFGSYAIARARGVPAAGIGPVPPGAPASWTLYLAAADADAVAEAVPGHGGRVLRPPHDVGELGRAFIAADPTGASFGVWQAGSHIGTRVVNEPGGLTWEDLRSPDPAAARAFYAGVFGHHTEPPAAAGDGYHLFSVPGDDVPLGGTGPRPGDTGPAHWLVYFAVADTDAAAQAAERAGGRVLSLGDTPYGRIAELADPDGALFAVLQTSGRDAPDRNG